jgi:hypothetical protein
MVAPDRLPARIHTSDADVPVEDLRLGDLVITREDGAEPVLWIGQRTVPNAFYLEVPGFARTIPKMPLPRITSRRQLRARPRHGN